MMMLGQALKNLEVLANIVGRNMCLALEAAALAAVVCICWGRKCARLRRMLCRGLASAVELFSIGDQLGCR